MSGSERDINPTNRRSWCTFVDKCTRKPWWTSLSSGIVFRCDWGSIKTGTKTGVVGILSASGFDVGNHRFVRVVILLECCFNMSLFVSLFLFLARNFYRKDWRIILSQNLLVLRTLSANLICLSSTCCIPSSIGEEVIINKFALF